MSEALALPATTHRPAAILNYRDTAHVRLDQLKSRIMIEGVEPDQVFMFSALISNSQIDSYFTRMSESSLRNYAEDANAGVAFLNSHNHNQLPVGYSISAKYEEGTNDDETYPRVTAEFYTVRGVNINGLPTDEFIKGVQFGLIRDVSIGFSGGTYICGLCGRDYFDWDCTHIPGVEYTVIDNPEDDPEDQIERTETAFVWVEDARLSEVSAVFDGATPDAMIIKAEREMKQGRLKPETKNFLERRYRIELKTPTLISVERSNEKEKETMNGDGKTSGAPDKFATLTVEARYAAKAVKLDVADDAEPSTIINKMRDEILRLQPFESQAAEAKVLRDAIIADAMKEAIRAHTGDTSFDAEATKKMLESLPADSVRSLSGSWKEIADAKLAGKTRQSQDNPDEQTGGTGEGGEGEKPVGDDPAPVDDDDDELEEVVDPGSGV